METKTKSPEMDLEAIVLAKYNRSAQNVHRVLEEFEQMKEPITKKDFLEEIEKQYPNHTEENLKDLVDDLYRDATIKSQNVTRMDFLDLKSEVFETKPENNEWDMFTSRAEMRELGEKYIIPNKYPITPMPDFDAYDPEEIYDLREDISNPIRPTITREKMWFDSPYNEVKHTKDEMFLTAMQMWNDIYNTHKPVSKAHNYDGQLDSILQSWDRKKPAEQKERVYEHYTKYERHVDPYKHAKGIRMTKEGQPIRNKKYDKPVEENED